MTTPTTPKLPEPATDKDSLTVVAWAATRTKDGKQTLLVPCITTNPAYVETHSRWDWKPHAVDHDQAQALAGEVERLRAEVAALTADAERYRWLRDHCTDLHVPNDDKFCLPDLASVSFMWRRREWVDGRPFVAVPTLDAAVDASLAVATQEAKA